MKRLGIHYETAESNPCGMTKDEVDGYAAKAAELLDLEPGGDVVSIVESLGGRVHYQNLLDMSAADDTIFVHKKHDFDIILSSFSGNRRNRFTLAHELGHYLLHSLQGKTPLVASRSGSNRAEWEANWFAGGFLMPSKAFLAEAKKGADLIRLARVFGVSEAAAEIRAKVLRIKA